MHQQRIQQIDAGPPSVPTAQCNRCGYFVADRSFARRMPDAVPLLAVSFRYLPQLPYLEELGMEGENG